MLLVSLAILSSTPREKISFGPARVDDGLNHLFESKVGWIGADGAYSFKLKDKVVWMFSDTWVGKIVDHKRVDATIVNNTVGVSDQDAVAFFVRPKLGGGSKAWIEPEDGKGFFWLLASGVIKKRGYVFLAQVDKALHPGVFGFEQIGMSLGTFDPTPANPLDWTVTQAKVPFCNFDQKTEHSYGLATCEVGDWLYIYGSMVDKAKPIQNRSLRVARVRSLDLTDFRKWRFWSGSSWTADPLKAMPQVSDMAGEGSVTYLPIFKTYFLTYTQLGLSPNIMVRTSKNPEGPWSDPTVVYQCPEPGADKKIFTYAAKNHPEIASGDELVISYATNSFDFWQVARDASLYIPRFIRVPIVANQNLNHQHER